MKHYPYGAPRGLYSDDPFFEAPSNQHGKKRIARTWKRRERRNAVPNELRAWAEGEPSK